MKKRWWLFIVVIGVAAVLVWVAVRWITAADSRAAEPEQRVTVRAELPRIGAIERGFIASGTLKAGGYSFELALYGLESLVGFP